MVANILKFDITYVKFDAFTHLRQSQLSL